MIADDAPDLAAIWSSSLSAALQTERAWDVATRFLAPRRLEDSQAELQPDEDTIAAVRLLQEHGRITDLLDWHTDETTRAIQSILAREIDSQLQASVASPVVHFIELVVRVASYLQIWSQPYEALGGSLPSSSKDVRQDPVSTFRKHFLSLLHPLLVRREFVDALRGFLEHLLELADLPDDAQDTSQTRDQREQEQLRAQAEQAVRAMHYLSLFQRFEPILFKVVYRAIDRRLQDSAPDNFEALDVLSGMVEWLLGPIRQWMASIYCLSWPDYDTPAAQLRLSKLLRPIMQRFEHYVYTSLLKLRTKEAFDIVVDYPASLPAVRDLQACMSKLDQTNFVVTSLARQIKKRLLHPGADTRDILTTYINLIKVLKLLDPSSVLLTKVTRSVREYLRSRRDTIRCIVQGMVDEDGDLLEELRGTHTGDEENGSVEAKELREKEEEQIEDYTDEGYTWTPAPVDAPPDYTAALRKADIIQLLVSIYDTKEMFVKELQKLMAQRLLRVKNYDVDAELRNIEILKIRFGEAALAGLEVMFKDIADSKRIDTSVHAAGSAMSIPGVNHDQALAIETMHATILSHLYWPPLPRAHTASVRLAGQMQKMTRTYEHIYRQLKSEKRLLFLPHASSVTLDIQLKDRTLEVECNPLQASILELLAPEKTVNGLAKIVSSGEPGPVKAALSFWQAKGVVGLHLPVRGDVHEDDLQWEVLEVRRDAVAQLPTFHAKLVEPEPQGAETTRSKDEILAALTPYLIFIKNILTNLHSMPTARLHSMLVAVAPGYKAGHYQASELELVLDEHRVAGYLARLPSGDWVLGRQ